MACAVLRRAEDSWCAAVGVGFYSAPGEVSLAQVRAILFLSINACRHLPTYSPAHRDFAVSATYTRCLRCAGGPGTYLEEIASQSPETRGFDGPLLSFAHLVNDCKTGRSTAPSQYFNGFCLLPAFVSTGENPPHGRWNVGIMQSPLRATVLPDCGGRSTMLAPTATTGSPVEKTDVQLAVCESSAI